MLTKEELRKHKGKVIITQAFLVELDEKKAKILFSEFYPLWITVDGMDTMAYYGLSPHFDCIEDTSQEAPTYMATLNIEGEEVTSVTFKKIETV